MKEKVESSEYELIAFYKEKESEIAAPARVFADLYGLRLRLEKLPAVTTTLRAFVGEHTVICLMNREMFGFYRSMKCLYALNRPVLLFPPLLSPVIYEHLILPVGYRSESREKVVWANFFRRHSATGRIELVVPQEKDEGIRDLVQDNVRFMEKVFRDSQISYDKLTGNGNWEKSLKKIFQEKPKGMVLLMRPFRFFSFYFPPLLRLARKYPRIPVMFIPRDDSLYIPCH